MTLINRRGLAGVPTILPKPNVEIEVQYKEIYDYLIRLSARLEEVFYILNAPKGKTWMPSNIPTTGNKAFDCNAATLDETRKALGRLVDDLRKGGILTSN